MKFPTEQEFQKIQKRIEDQTGIRFIHKGWYYRFLKWTSKSMLKRMGLDVSGFLKSRYIYIPKRVGGVVLCPQPIEGTGRAIDRVHGIAVMAHEIRHNMQKDSLGSPLLFETMYAGNATRRVYEVQADLAKADVYRYFGLDKYNNAQKWYDTEWTKIYGLDAGDAHAAKEQFFVGLNRHKNNRYASDAGALVCKEIRKVMTNES